QVHSCKNINERLGGVAIDKNNSAIGQYPPRVDLHHKEPYAQCYGGDQHHLLPVESRLLCGLKRQMHRYTTHYDQHRTIYKGVGQYRLDALIYTTLCVDDKAAGQRCKNHKHPYHAQPKVEPFRFLLRKLFFILCVLRHGNHIAIKSKSKINWINGKYIKEVNITFFAEAKSQFINNFKPYQLKINPPIRDTADTIYPPNPKMKGSRLTPAINNVENNTMNAESLSFFMVGNKRKPARL